MPFTETTDTRQVLTRRTYVVLGCPRGGTSLLAGALNMAGVYMGNFTTAQYEDPEFKLKRRKAAEAEKRLPEVIKQRNLTHVYWGWKLPDSIYYIDAIRQLLVNPYYLVIYRDEEAIARSSAFHDGRDWQQQGEHLLKVARIHTGLVKEFVERCDTEFHEFQLEDIHARPELFVDRFLDIVSPLQPDPTRLLGFVNPEGGYTGQSCADAGSVHDPRVKKTVTYPAKHNPMMLPGPARNANQKRRGAPGEGSGRSLGFDVLTGLYYLSAGSMRANIRRRYPLVHNTILRVAKAVGLNTRLRNRQRTYRDEDFTRDFLTLNMGGYELAVCNRPLRDKRGIGRVTRALIDTLSKQAAATGPKTAKGMRQRVYFFSSIHWCPDVLPEPAIIQVHDVIPLLFPRLNPEQTAYWQKYLVPLAKQASAIVTISETSAADIVRTLGVRKERVHVVYNGITRLPVADDLKIDLPGRPYLVYLGQYGKHKNVEVVLSALANPSLGDMAIVIIGQHKQFRKEIRKLGIADRVLMTGFIDDAQVGRIVSDALALLLPSHYEGFGLPPFEAALLGVPSVCANRRAMTELLDGCVLFADPNRPDDWVRCILELKNSKTLRDRLVCELTARANQFAWERTAQSLLDVIRLNIVGLPNATRAKQD